jgi:hypothetical protein
MCNDLPSTVIIILTVREGPGVKSEIFISKVKDAREYSCKSETKALVTYIILDVAMISREELGKHRPKLDDKRFEAHLSQWSLFARIQWRHVRGDLLGITQHDEQTPTP